MKRTALSFALVLVSLHCSERAADRPYNFAVVEPPSAPGGAIYRGGRPSPFDVAAMRCELRLRTIGRLNRGDASVDRALAVLRDSRHRPVYIHCDHGRDLMRRYLPGITQALARQ